MYTTIATILTVYPCVRYLSIKLYITFFAVIWLKTDLCTPRIWCWKGWINLKIQSCIIRKLCGRGLIKTLISSTTSFLDFLQKMSYRFFSFTQKKSDTEIQTCSTIYRITNQLYDLLRRIIVFGPISLLKLYSCNQYCKESQQVLL